MVPFRYGPKRNGWNDRDLRSGSRLALSKVSRWLLPHLNSQPVTDAWSPSVKGVPGTGWLSVSTFANRPSLYGSTANCVT